MLPHQDAKLNIRTQSKGTTADDKYGKLRKKAQISGLILPCKLWNTSRRPIIEVLKRKKRGCDSEGFAREEAVEKYHPLKTEDPQSDGQQSGCFIPELKKEMEVRKSCSYKQQFKIKGTKWIPSTSHLFQKERVANPTHT